MRKLQVDTEIISLREPQDRCTANAEQFGVRWVECPTHRYLPLGWPRRFKRALRLACSDAAHQVVAHDAGIWLPSNRYVAEVASELDVPRVVSPRGMLSEWALNHGSARKKLAWRLHQRRNLESASLLHATADSEADEFRKCGLRNPIAIVPNGVDLPPVRNNTGAPTAERTALFLSRIHPKKGLLDLVNAWAAVQPINWRLRIVGDDEGGHRSLVASAVDEQGIGEQVEFLGPVADAEKWDLYAKADLFVLPSYSENFGIVVAEALAAGVPVITTRATPWGELVSTRSGWWIDTGAESLAAALGEATQKSDAERRAMGERGRNLVESRYSWGAAAEKMLACYLWLLGEAERPHCVQLRLLAAGVPPGG